MDSGRPKIFFSVPGTLGLLLPGPWLDMTTGSSENVQLGLLTKRDCRLAGCLRRRDGVRISSRTSNGLSDDSAKARDSSRSALSPTKNQISRAEH